MISDRHKPKENGTVRLTYLDEPALNILCPIKIILILALRCGEVDANCISRLLATLPASRNRKVIWIHPHRQVLPAFSVQNTRLLPDKAARALIQVTKSARILSQIRPHDLRRDTAKDLDNLEEPITGQAMPAIATGLRQAYYTYILSTTVTYSGPATDGIHAKRARTSKQDAFTKVAYEKNPPKRKKNVNIDAASLSWNERPRCGRVCSDDLACQ